jgi:hypothetical protein
VSRPTLRRRALNRATLARQLLLRRHELTPLQAIEHLVGLQAQTPHTWYVGLWDRLVDFRAEAAAQLLTSREAVRIAVMRSTIHLVTGADALGLRPQVQPVLERGLRSNFGRHLEGLDRAELAAAGRELVDERPLTFSELGRALAQRFPGRDEASLAQAIRAWVPLVQVPPRGVWGKAGRAAHTSAESWLGRPVDPAYPVERMVLRYLGAFGPASVRDVQMWSGLTRLSEVVDRLRPDLVTFRDEAGVELLDLPGAARPDPDTPAPVRLLYDFDNLLLSHADRSRIATEPYQRMSFAPEGIMPRLVLVDGFTAGTWTTTSDRRTTTVTVIPFERLSTRDIGAVEAEATGLLRFLVPSQAHLVRVTAPAI